MDFSKIGKIIGGDSQSMLDQFAQMASSLGIDTGKVKNLYTTFQENYSKLPEGARQKIQEQFTTIADAGKDKMGANEIVKNAYQKIEDTLKEQLG